MKKLFIVIIISCVLFSCKSRVVRTTTIQADSTFSINQINELKEIQLLDVNVKVVKINDSLKISVVKNNVKPREIRRNNRIEKLQLKARLTKNKFNNSIAVNDAKAIAKIHKIENKNSGVKIPFKVKLILTFFGILFLLMICISIAAWGKHKLQ